MEDPIYRYLKLFMDYFSIWSLMFLGLIVWLIRNPERLKIIPYYISSARVGNFEVQLRQIEQKLTETEEHLSEIEEENSRLNTLYDEFDIHAPAHTLERTRQSLKALAGNLDNIAPVLEGLEPGADPADVYAAAVILRARRDLSAFDALLDGLDRIGSDDKLEGLRYQTVWTLASAVHRTILAAVKHTDTPKLSLDQLERARGVMKKLHDNPHVQHDCPERPNQGIRGPASYAMNWIDKGFEKYEKLDDS